MTVVETVATKADAKELDELLWRILWQPIGLPRDVRREFSVNGEELELIAKEKGRIVGGLVAIWTSEREVELRHLAVAASAQGKGVGRSLVDALLHIATSRKCQRIRTVARNTSVGFFRKLGFQMAEGQAPEHPTFVRHGITFKLMEKSVEPAGAGDA